MPKKYEAAVKYYEKGEYYKALPILEELVPVYRGTSKGEKAYYYFAYSYYHLGNFEAAAYHFENFVESFPSSSYTEECQFMNAYCYFLDSPIYSLDQTNTYKAINKLQLYINKYPNSPRVTQSNELMDRLRFKLETKAFELAKMYYFQEDYRSSVYSFRNVIRSYPASIYTEDCLFYAAKASYIYANKSIETKKQERLIEADDACVEFISAFPESKYIKEITGLKADINKQIEKNTNTKTTI